MGQSIPLIEGQERRCGGGALGGRTSEISQGKFKKQRSQQRLAKRQSRRTHFEGRGARRQALRERVSGSPSKNESAAGYGTPKGKPSRREPASAKEIG